MELRLLYFRMTKYFFASIRLMKNLISLKQSEIFSKSFHTVTEVLTPSSLMSDFIAHVHVVIFVRSVTLSFVIFTNPKN